MATSKFQRWFDALTCNIINISIFKWNNYTMSWSFKQRICVDSESWTLRGSWKLPKAACSRSILGCFNNLKAVPTISRGVVDLFHHLKNHLQTTQRRRMFGKIPYGSSSNISKHFHKMSTSWTQVKKYKRPLGSAGEDVEGFLCCGQKTYPSDWMKIASTSHSHWNCFSLGKKCLFPPLE